MSGPRPQPVGVLLDAPVVTAPLLVVEDNAGDARLVQEMLLRRCPELTVRVVGTLDAACGHLRDVPASCVLLDLSLPDADGLDGVLRIHADVPDVPIVVLTGHDDEALAARALSEGAQDYLVKDRIDAHYLIRTIRHAIERKAAEAVLRERERQLAEAQRLARVGSWEWDPASDRVTWSEEMCRIFGVDPDLATRTYDDWLQHVHPGDRPMLDTMLRRAAVSESAFALQHRVVQGDGGLHWQETRGRLRRGRNGAVTTLLGTAQDVTEQKQAADALRTSEERHRRIVETTREGVWTIDAQSRTDFVNRRMADLLGYASEDLVGRNPVDLVGEHDRAAASELFAGVAAGELREEELTLVRSDAAEIRAVVRVTALNDDAGDLVGSLAMVSDVTDRRRADRELRARAAQQAAVAALGQRALAGGPLEELLAEAVMAATSTLEVDHAHVLELPHASSDFVVLAGRPPSDLPPRLVAVVREHAAQTLESAGPVVFQGVGAPGGGGQHEPDDRLSGVSVVVDGPGPPSRVLIGYVARDRSFTDDDVHFLQALANIVATAIERQRADEQIRRQALHDPLTGLPNRTLFLDRLAHAMDRAGRRQSNVAVLFVDLDRFKLINDSLGHQVGDEVLVAVGRLLSRAVRPGDTVARLGGDEFVVCCEDLADPHEAMMIAKRLTESVASMSVVKGRDLYLTASVGIAVAPAGDGATPDELVRDADVAMYRAKEQGRSRSELFDDDMRTQAVRRLALEGALRRAVERGEFVVLYHPQVDLATGAVTGVEALIRWDDPERGLVAPGEFIAVAEETTLIVPIGTWVIEEACTQGAAWHAGHDRPLLVSVNLSARQLVDRDLPAAVQRALGRSGLPPSSLCLEITESVVMEDPAASLTILRELKALGVRLAIDDFGTGHSSLAYLKRLPVDFLKIDRSFVDGLGRDPEDSAIVAAIVTLARSLGVEIIPEGVETACQLSELSKLGLTCGQGFYWSRPLAAEQITELLQRDEGEERE